MTFLEKLKEDYPNKKINEFCIGIGCPSQYNYETGTNGDCKGISCFECWNREMPNTEPKQKVVNPPTQETLDFIHENIEVIQPQFSNPVIEKAYNTGLNDAWEFAKKLVGVLDDFVDLSYDEVFGYGIDLEIMNVLTIQEAIAKLKAYEEKQKVFLLGEVVEIEGTYERAIVIVNKQDGRYKVLHDDFEIVTYTKDKLKKTGKHLDIQLVLNQIGGE